MNRRVGLVIGTSFVTCLLSLVVAAPAGAVTNEQKLSVISAWTQTSLASYNAWFNARQNQTHQEYGFDWSTDYCSSSPDQPSGFDFRMPCARHDFGHRNYAPFGLWTQNKPRVDDAFYADLRRKCDTYSSWVRPACYSLAWSYYQAVRTFGELRVSQAELDKGAQLKARGEAARAAAEKAAVERR